MESRRRVVDEFTLGAVVAHGLVGDTHLAASRGGAVARQAHLTLLDPARAALWPWAHDLVGVEVDPGLARLEAVGGPGPGRAGWLATDIVRGEPLEVAIATSSLLERARAARRLAGALAALHARGRAHGHVNPDSLALRRERTGALLPLLLHVGARLALAPEATAAGPLARRVHPYLAPEAVDRLAPSSPGPEAPADVHALGAVLCELLTGRAPGTLEGATTAAAIQRDKARRTHFVAALQDEGDRLDLGALNALLARCLSPTAADRPTAAEAAVALDACLDGAAGRPDGATAQPSGAAARPDGAAAQPSGVPAR